MQVESNKLEEVTLGLYIRSLQEGLPRLYEKVLQIFMGVLIEEFISCVSETGVVNSQSPVTVFFDTSLILRLLGCSGNILKTATIELVDYLTTLGFKLRFFAGNEEEVANIIDTIISLKNSNREIIGETAEALASGEISITDIRVLQNTFVEELEKLGLEEQESETMIVQRSNYQIDEVGFAKSLRSQSSDFGRAYSIDNLQRDASYLGKTMRLRAGHTSRDLAGSRYIFVTHNRTLSSASRRFLLSEGMLRRQDCPPILNASQLATIAWLMRDHEIVPERASRELLSNCIAAYRPDDEWFRYFREGVEKTTESIETFGRSAASALTLQAARRIAQEESFSNSSLLRELNMGEILKRAAEETERVRRVQEEVIVRIEQEAADKLAQTFRTLRTQAEADIKEAERKAGLEARE